MDTKHFLDEMKVKLSVSSYEELAYKIGATPSALGKWIQRNKIPDKWLMIMGQISEKYDTNQYPDNKSNTIPISKLKATASAGGGNEMTGIDVYDSGEVMHIDRGIFKTPPKNKLAMMKVDGYSMTPMLYPDSWVIFEEQSSFEGDGLYILNFDNTLMVKLLQANIISGDIDIISANKDYKSYKYNPKETQISFYIIGKVLRIIM